MEEVDGIICGTGANIEWLWVMGGFSGILKRL